MVLKFREKDLHFTNLIAWISMGYLLLMSGSVLQILNMGLFQKWNMYIAVAGLVFLAVKSKRITLRLDLSSTFLILACISILLIPILWNEMNNFVVNTANFCLLLTPFIITKIVGFEDFKRVYLKMMLLLVAVSLLFFNFPDLLAVIPKQVMVRSDGGWSYDFYYLYAQYSNRSVDIYNRNIGIFWEPGMYQGFVLFAMMLVAAEKPITKGWVFYQLIMAVCVLTIKSTTGYILLLPILLIYLLRFSHRMTPRTQVLLVVAVLILMIVLLVFPGAFMGVLKVLPGNVEDKLTDDNLSFSTRMYGMLADLKLAVQHPLGVGVSSVDALRAETIANMNAVSDGANINTTFTMMLYHGVIPGILFLCICCRACMRMSGSALFNGLFLLMSMVIINTEPHYLTLFFTTAFFYYSSAPKPEKKILA